MPKALTNEPELDIWLVDYVKAFNVLSSSRQVGMSVGAIPLSEIVQYCTIINETDIDFFVTVIRKADNAYMDYVNRDKKVKLPDKKQQRKK